MSSKWLYGNGGHAKVILQHWKADYIVDDADPKRQWSYAVPLTYRYGLIGVGDNRTRKAIADRIEKDEPMYGILDAPEHETAVCDVGTVIMRGAIIQPGSWIRMHSIINTGATIDHDCEIADFVHIAPGCHLCGNVTVGEGTLVGAGTIVTPGVRIGSWLTIPAGSVVTRDCLNEDDVANLRRR